MALDGAAFMPFTDGTNCEQSTTVPGVVASMSGVNPSSGTIATAQTPARSGAMLPTTFCRSESVTAAPWL